MDTPRVMIVPEGLLEEHALRRIVAHCAPRCGISSFLNRPNRDGMGRASGRDTLRLNIGRYFAASKTGRMVFVALRDLERNYHCAPELIADWKMTDKVHPNFVLNIAVRSTEAWLLADTERIASFLSISQSRAPTRPDELPDPKTELVNLARRSRSSRVREAIVPPQGSPNRIGPGYTAHISEFVHQRWRINVAAERSPSLARALGRISRLV